MADRQRLRDRPTETQRDIRIHRKTQEDKQRNRGRQTDKPTRTITDTQTNTLKQHTREW